MRALVGGFVLNARGFHPRAAAMSRWVRPLFLNPLRNLNLVQDDREAKVGPAMTKQAPRTPQTVAVVMIFSTAAKFADTRPKNVFESLPLAFSSSDSAFSLFFDLTGSLASLESVSVDGIGLLFFDGSGQVVPPLRCSFEAWSGWLGRHRLRLSCSCTRN